MKKFRSKPVFVKAEQWFGKVKQTSRLLSEGVIMNIPSLDGSCLVPTLSGNVTCMPTDYIVRNDSGFISVCDAETFESLFDLQVSKSALKSLSEAIDTAMTAELVPDRAEPGIAITVEGIIDEPIKEVLTLDKIRAKKAATEKAKE